MYWYPEKVELTESFNEDGVIQFNAIRNYSIKISFHIIT